MARSCVGPRKNNALTVAGAAGVGKTELCACLRERGYATMNVEFMDMPRYKLDPRSATMECLWATQWIHSVMKQDRSAGGGRDQVYISDRSPLSAAYYAKSMGAEMGALFEAQREELRRDAGVHVYTVYLRADEDVIWSRVQRRLRANPVRARYGEDDREWLRKTVAHYNSAERGWDFTVDNGPDVSIEALADHIIDRVVPDIKRAISAK